MSDDYSAAINIISGLYDDGYDRIAADPEKFAVDVIDDIAELRRGYAAMSQILNDVVKLGVLAQALIDAQEAQV